MKKVIYFFTLLIAVTFLSSCEDNNAPEVVTLEDGIYLGIYGNYSAVAYDVQKSQITSIGFAYKTVKTIPIDNRSFTVIPEDKNITPFVCIKSKLTKNDYLPAVAGDKNKEFFGLHFMHNNKNMSYNSGLFMAVKDASQSGYYDITLVAMNGRYEKTTATIITENDHQKMSFVVSPIISNNYEGNDETWNVTFGGITGFQFGTNVLDISMQINSILYGFQAVTIYN